VPFLEALAVPAPVFGGVFGMTAPLLLAQLP
jgi:hypothetical protein